MDPNFIYALVPASLLIAAGTFILVRGIVRVLSRPGPADRAEWAAVRGPDYEEGR